MFYGLLQAPTLAVIYPYKAYVVQIALMYTLQPHNYYPVRMWKCAIITFSNVWTSQAHNELILIQAKCKYSTAVCYKQCIYINFKI